MNESTKCNTPIWVVVLISAGVALFISAAVTLALNIPWLAAQRTFPVPNLVDLTVDAAEKEVAKHRWVIITTGQEPSDMNEGLILRQIPAPGTKIRRAEVIRVVQSKGRPMISVPELRGLSIPQATETLQREGLFVLDVISSHDTLPEDMVVGSEPPAGANIEKGSKIKLVVSLGPLLEEVPKVTGRKLQAARKILEDKGFIIRDIRYEVTTEYYYGTVMRQSPKAGEMALKGSPVDLVVAGVLR